MIAPAAAATPSSTRPASVSCSRSFPTPNSTPYPRTQPATQSIRLPSPPADGRTSGARVATGPQPAREGRARRENATGVGPDSGRGRDASARHTTGGTGPVARPTAAKAHGPSLRSPPDRSNAPTSPDQAV